jgi:hypothetical protein
MPLPMGQTVQSQMPQYSGMSYLEQLKRLLMQNPQLMQELMMKKPLDPNLSLNPDGTMRQFIGNQTGDTSDMDADAIQSYRNRIGRRVQI